MRRLYLLVNISDTHVCKKHRESACPPTSVTPNSSAVRHDFFKAVPHPLALAVSGVSLTSNLRDTAQWLFWLNCDNQPLESSHRGRKEEAGAQGPSMKGGNSEPVG